MHRINVEVSKGMNKKKYFVNLLLENNRLKSSDPQKLLEIRKLCVILESLSQLIDKKESSTINGVNQITFPVPINLVQKIQTVLKKENHNFSITQHVSQIPRIPHLSNDFKTEINSNATGNNSLFLLNQRFCPSPSSSSSNSLLSSTNLEEANMSTKAIFKSTTIPFQKIKPFPGVNFQEDITLIKRMSLNTFEYFQEEAERNQEEEEENDVDEISKVIWL